MLINKVETYNNFARKKLILMKTLQKW